MLELAILKHGEFDCLNYSMCFRLDAATTIVRKQEINDGTITRYATEVLVRKIPDDQEVKPMNICIMSSVS